MRTAHTTLKKIAKLGLFLLLGSAISACSSTMRWTEEVKLHDGQVIDEKRYVNLGGYLYLDSRERVSIDETATFTLPGSNKIITWKIDFRDSQSEPNSLNMIRFDVVHGIPYLATYPAGCIAYNKWGRPDPPQILFKYENEQWKRITVAELPSELIGMSANVIVGTPASSLLKSFYTVEGVNAKNAPISTVEYKTILREPVKGVWSGCPDMVSDGNGGWIGRDWFTDQPSLEACLKYCEHRKIGAQYCLCNSIFKGK